MENEWTQEIDRLRMTNTALRIICGDLVCAVNLARQEQHIRDHGDDLRTCGYDETADKVAAKVAAIVDRARAAIAMEEGVKT